MWSITWRNMNLEIILTFQNSEWSQRKLSSGTRGQKERSREELCPRPDQHHVRRDCLHLRPILRHHLQSQHQHGRRHQSLHPGPVQWHVPLRHQSHDRLVRSSQCQEEVQKHQDWVHQQWDSSHWYQIKYFITLPVKAIKNFKINVYKDNCIIWAIACKVFRNNNNCIVSCYSCR